MHGRLLKQRFELLAHPICFRSPRWLPNDTRAQRPAEHIPFVFTLVDLLHPESVLALGGSSVLFSAACQAVDELRLACTCTRVVTGDSPFRRPGEAGEALDPETLYPAFAKRLETGPGGALERIADGSVDLLLLEGFPSGAREREHLDPWLTKLSAKGVVLLHDTEHRAESSIPSTPWARLRRRFRTVHFDHGGGLGLVVVGHELPASLHAFLEADEQTAEYRRFFCALGEATVANYETSRLDPASRSSHEILAQRQRVVAELRSELKARDDALEHLQNRAARAEADLLEMMKSRAWRITAPIRIVAAWARRALRVLRRRATVFELDARNDLLAIDEGTFNWNSIGPDPFFYARPRAGGHPRGWVKFSAEVDSEDPDSLSPRIYLDPGNGYAEASSLLLYRASEAEFTAIVRLPAGTNGLRFDPLEAPGRLSVGTLRCREISAIEGISRLCWPSAVDSLRSPRVFLSRAGRLLRAWRAGGPDFIWRELQAGSVGSLEHYDAWVEAFDTLRTEDRARTDARLGRLHTAPSISVVMPVYNTEIRWLRKAIESVVAQWYPHWELCVADDASSDPRVRKLLEEYTLRDSRIKVSFRKHRGNISAATNTALEMAGGDFVALLDHDDELRPHALLCVAEEISEHPDAEVIYSDEDKIDRGGRRFDPYFKPDWNPDLFYSQNYINHLAVCKRARLVEVGGFREGYEGAQDYDLFLRLLNHVQEERIRHIPHVLYHWRATAGSTGLDGHEKEYAHEAARRALRSHFEANRQRDVRVEPAFKGSFHHRVVWPLPEPRPLVSVVIPTRDQAALLRKAVRGCLEGVDYPEIEVLVVDHESQEKGTLELLDALQRDPRVHVLRYRGAFNFSAINNFAIAQCKGQLVALLNNDVEAISGGWLREMVSQAIRPEIGAVGAMLYYPNDKIQHAGVVIGLGSVAGHAHKHFARGSYGHGGRAQVVQNFSAVTGACLMTRREILEEVGPLDENNLQVAFNDVDLCLRIRERGYRVLWTPYAEFYHFESASRGLDESGERLRRFHREIDVMKERWGTHRTNDPYYNPNLTLDREDFSLSFPPRNRKRFPTV